MVIRFSSIYNLITGQSLPKFVAIFYPGMSNVCLKDKLCPNLTLQNVLKRDNYLDQQFLETAMFLRLILSELYGLFYGGLAFKIYKEISVVVI
jgi:hypothetical protein